ncbi:MAG TPA: hypothetical protein VJ765_06090 [Chitinophagaceae bacterium]|nr:hypothetical protein [Chitinophagaceae bacterium]
MQDELYEFLILNKKLSLPGIGTICLLQSPPQLDFANKELSPRSYYFTIESASDQPSKKLFDWLASAIGIAEWDAIKLINEFSFTLKKNLSESGEVNWENIGTIRRDDKGQLKLDSQTIVLQSERPVPAEKVIREKVQHTLLVGEKEKSSAEMEEYFAGVPATRNYTWLIAIVLTIISIMFIGWHFSEKGFAPSSAGNQSVIKSK